MNDPSSTAVPRNEWRDAVWQSDLPTSQLIVALCFADHAGSATEAWVSPERGCQRTRLGRTAWHTARRALVASGWLTETRPATASSTARYAFSLPVGVRVSPPDTLSDADTPGCRETTAAGVTSRHQTPTGTPTQNTHSCDDLPTILDCLPVETIGRRPVHLDYDELDDLHAFLDDVDPAGIDAAWLVVDDVTQDDATDAQLDHAQGWALAAYVATAQGTDAHQTVQAHADRLDADLDRQLLQLLDVHTWRTRTAAENFTPPPLSLGRWPAHAREAVAA